MRPQHDCSVPQCPLRDRGESLEGRFFWAGTSGRRRCRARQDGVLDDQPGHGGFGKQGGALAGVGYDGGGLWYAEDVSPPVGLLSRCDARDGATDDDSASSLCSKPSGICETSPHAKAGTANGASQGVSGSGTDVFGCKGCVSDESSHPTEERIVAFSPIGAQSTHCVF